MRFNALLTGIFVFILSVHGALALDFADQYDRNVEAVVKVYKGMSNGTGWFITDNLLVTAAHVIEGEGDDAMISGNDFYLLRTPVKILYADIQTDVAILKLEAEHYHRFVNLEKPTKLLLARQKARTGSEYWAIGNRLGFWFHSYYGHISRANQASPLNKDAADIHFIDGEFFPGDSGGPVFNKDGEVIGIAKAFLDTSKRTGINTDNLEMITTSDSIKKSFRDFIDNGGRRLDLDSWKMMKWDFSRIDGSVVLLEVPKQAEKTAKFFGLTSGAKNIIINGYNINSPNEFGRMTALVSVNDEIRVEYELGEEKVYKIMRNGTDISNRGSEG